ncbi:PJA2 ligase, partial [Pedionomus torquatus]|nr:PJA2 ligase [Pedionomus torquatus]
MGQEAGKSAWPKPARGYWTFTGRRYGRGHACVSFTPSLSSQDRDEYQYEDCEQLEWEDVQKENFLCSYPSVEFSPGFLDEPVLENIGTREPTYRSVSSQTFESNVPPFPLLSCGLEGNRMTGNFMNPYENFEGFPEYACGGYNDSNVQNGIAFVNIDSYEPDSSDGEEDGAQDKFSLVEAADCVFQGTLDSMFSELERNIESLTDLKSQLSTLSQRVSMECCEEAGPVSLMRYHTIDSGFSCPGNRISNSSVASQTTLKSNFRDASCETQQTENMADVEIGAPITIANELNVSGGMTDQGNSPDLVVRPKIRNPSTANQLQREIIHEDNKKENGSWRRDEVAEIQQGHVEYALGNSEEMTSYSLELNNILEGQKNRERVLQENAAVQEQKQLLGDSTVWDDFEDCNGHFSMSYNDEDSSEWSDGEWSAAVSAYFAATEKDQTSSDESWETALGQEECDPEVQSNSSTEVEDTDVCSLGEQEQTIFEEGEIFRFWYRDEVESSSDDEIDAVSDFVLPALFPLHRHNIEDDFMAAEEQEWRIIDELVYNMWFPRVNPYMDPPFPAFMALEGHSQQAMEAAMLSMESLGFDAEHAHPPATKETIDCLPQIIFTVDNESQQQSCTICCSEYVKDEVITELPCHHLFHKLCVTLWLQKSGTCPLCRHVLAPMPLEADPATVSFI